MRSAFISHRRSLRCAISTLTVGFAMVTAHSAEPAWKAGLFPQKLGPHPMLDRADLSYTLSWNGILKAGEIKMAFGVRGVNKPGAYVVTSNARSLGLASKLFPYTSNSWCELHNSSMLPRYFQAKEIDKQENLTTTLRYGARSVQVEETSIDFETGKTTKSTSEFKFSPVHDQFSAMLFIRSQTLAAGQNIKLVIQPFRTPYLLDVTSHGTEKHRDRNAIRLTVKLQKIDKDTLALREYKKMKKAATLWLTADAVRVPLEFRVDTFIGDVRAVLD